VIFSIVDRPRYGLLEHSQALCFYADFVGIPVKSIVHASLPKKQGELYFSMKFLLKRKKSTIVLWAFGPSVLFLPWLRLRGNRVIMVFHEPGGLWQRLRKGDGLLYSMLVSLIEKTFCSFSSSKVTPNRRNAEGKFLFAPLIFKQALCGYNFDHRLKRPAVYLGRKDQRRCFQEFLELSNSKPQDYVFFPSKNSSSETEKQALVTKARCVFNVYRVDHNQSGVTPDALRCGTPVVVGANDAWAADILALKLGSVINIDSIKSGVDVERAINQVVKDEAMSRRCYEYSDEEFGFTAFLKYWRDLLEP